MKSAASSRPDPVSHRRRSWVSAMLAAPWVTMVSGCGESAAGAPPTTTPLGNPQVPRDPLRNYVFGPVMPVSPTGEANVGVGEAVLGSLTTGHANTAVGDQALWQQQDGFNCVAVGSLALFNAVSCIDCTAVGTGALMSAQSGVGATAIGRLSCSELIEGNNNSGFGDSALRFMTSGVANTAVGYRSAETNVTGSGNVIVGSHAALNMPAGDRNVVVGFHAMWAADAGSDENVAVGVLALEGATGGRNVAVGAGAGRSVTSGSGNVFLGPEAGSVEQQKADVANSIAIGDRAFATQDNQVVIGNERTETFVLGGVAISKNQLIRLLALIGA